MARAAKAWERQVKEHFEFLTEYGFRLNHSEAKSWATTARYLSPTLGIEITRSLEFDRIEISLLRLVEGHAPEHEVWLTERPLDRVLFDNVLFARDTDLADSAGALKGLSDEAVETQLRFWADALRSAAPDFLRGDDAAILDGERVIRERNADEAQELTIWLPADATAEDEERAVERARRTTPPEVRISTRRYSR